jgi:hypothetical protein
MRVMMLIKHPSDYDIKNVPPSLFPAMGEFVQDMINKGIMLDGAGLQPLTKATRIRIENGELRVTDGPFPGATEVVGGYSLCEVRDHAHALEIGRRFMELHRVHWPEFKGETEIRPLEDMGEGA